jgi:hypothetical protein
MTVDLPLYMPIREWCELTRMSRSKVYSLMKRRLLRTKKLDGRRLVDVRQGLTFLENLPEE